MLSTPREFAQTLRSMRPDYATTLHDVRLRIKQHAERGHRASVRHYTAALRVLLAKPEEFGATIDKGE